MDGQAFDDLARALARRASRRSAIRFTLAGLAAGLTGQQRRASAVAAPPRRLREPTPLREPRALRDTTRCRTGNQSPCGDACCPSDLVCVDDFGCMPDDAEPCGDGYCPGDESCQDDLGCLPNGTPCGDGYCPSDLVCIEERGCMPADGIPCGGGYCHSTQVCSTDAECLRSCPSGQEACNGICADLGADPSNCGACGNDCAALPNVQDATCDAGDCAVIACAAGYCDLDGDAGNGCEEPVDLTSDPANCGSCGNTCASGESCVDGQCSGGGVCTSRSSCGDRQYCNAEQTCICVESIEGDLRCGQLPSSCNVPTCSSTADCAQYGDGYFCDQPDSGCCNEQISRCLAPCGAPPCPPERECGTRCCQAEENCVDGECIAPCTVDADCADAPACSQGICDVATGQCTYQRLPNETPCPTAGELCCGGVCVAAENGACPSGGGECADDPPTASSMEAAHAALVNGATEVDVSPGGCVRYSRTVVNGTVSDETLTLAGRPVIVWQHQGNQSTGLRDADGDGLYEWEATVQRTGGDDGIWQETESDPTTGSLVQRVTYTVTGDTVHVLVEIDDGSGSLVPDMEFDTTTVAVAGSAGFGASGPERAMTTSGFPLPCGAAKEQEIREQLRKAVDEGLQCLHTVGASDLERAMTWHYVNDTIDIACYESQDTVFAGIKTWVPFLDIRSLEINRTNYDSSVSEFQRRTLWHELLHVPLGPHVKHETIDASNPFAGKFDRVYACEQLCYGSNPDRCICARCLGTDVCDPRCQKYTECDTDEGALCLCPTRQKYYPSRTTCAVECPRGLACAFAGCKTLKDLQCK